VKSDGEDEMNEVEEGMRKFYEAYAFTRKLIEETERKPIWIVLREAKDLPHYIKESLAHQLVDMIFSELGLSFAQVLGICENIKFIRFAAVQRFMRRHRRELMEYLAEREVEEGEEGSE